MSASRPLPESIVFLTEFPGRMRLRKSQARFHKQNEGKPP